MCRRGSRVSRAELRSVLKRPAPRQRGGTGKITRRCSKIPNPKSQNPKPKFQTRASKTQRHRENEISSESLCLCGSSCSLGVGVWDLGLGICAGLRLASTVLARRCVMATDSKDAVAHV